MRRLLSLLALCAIAGFATPGMAEEQPAAPAAAAPASLLWSGVVAFLAYKITDIVIGLRVSEDEEREGLDETQHGERAYNL